MTAELVRGQNQALAWTQLEIGVEADRALTLGAVLVGAGDTALGGAETVALPGGPGLPGVGVPGPPATSHRLAVDLDALPADTTRLDLFLTLPVDAGAPARFGAFPAPRALLVGPDGAEAARYEVTGLADETAVVAVELYRRRGAWKIRAVGQGYQGGLPALLADRGIDRESAHRLAATARSLSAAPAPAPPRETPAPAPAVQGSAPVPPQGSARGPAASAGPVDYTHPRRRPTAPGTGHPYTTPARPAPPPPAGAAAEPVAGDATGWSMEERLHNQVWGMFEDLARTVAAYRGAVEFAEDRRERETDAALDDPRARGGQRAADARATASERYGTLVARAQEALDRDLAQLTAESRVVEPALPMALAGWDSPVWHAYRPPERPPLAVRLGDLRLPEAPELRVPMLVRLPLERGLWIDAGRLQDGEGESRPAGLRALAAESAALLTLRLLAVHPPGALTPTCSIRRAPARPPSPGCATPGCSHPRRPRGRPGSPRCWSGSPDGSTWCRWRSAAAPTTRCRPASTPPGNSWWSTTSRTVSTTGPSPGCGTSPTRARPSASTCCWSPTARTPPRTARCWTRSGADCCGSHRCPTGVWRTRGCGTSGPSSPRVSRRAARCARR